MFLLLGTIMLNEMGLDKRFQTLQSAVLFLFNQFLVYNASFYKSGAARDDVIVLVAKGTVAPSNS